MLKKNNEITIVPIDARFTQQKPSIQYVVTSAHERITSTHDQQNIAIRLI
jgi:hypothetical protein